jgi:hypothetical protein
MGFWDILAGSTPAGVAGSAVQAFGETLFGGIDRIIRDFKLPPEQLVEYEKFKLTAQAQLEQIAAADRDSARKREIATQDPTNRRLAYAIVVVFGAAQYMVFTHPFPPDQAIMVARVLGTIDMALGLVLGFYFGSSASSARKDDIIGRK